jgi:hypothetical protein
MGPVINHSPLTFWSGRGLSHGTVLTRPYSYTLFRSSATLLFQTSRSSCDISPPIIPRMSQCHPRVSRLLDRPYRVQNRSSRRKVITKLHFQYGIDCMVSIVLHPKSGSDVMRKNVFKISSVELTCDARPGVIIDAWRMMLPRCRSVLKVGVSGPNCGPQRR